MRTLLMTIALALLCQSCYAESWQMEVEATAYYYNFGTGITATGHKCIPWRTLAVDPNVIPYGSKVYFHRTGEVYIADDTGSSIVGNKVDKALGDEEACYEYGRRIELVTVTTEEDD